MFVILSSILCVYNACDIARIVSDQLDSSIIAYFYNENFPKNESVQE
jgi:hypothetical protein